VRGEQYIQEGDLIIGLLYFQNKESWLSNEGKEEKETDKNK
jgi:hypothetical protein